MAWVHRAGLSEHCVWNRPGSSLLLSEGFQLSKMSVAHTLEKMKETLSTAMELKAKGASPADIKAKGTAASILLLDLKAASRDASMKTASVKSVTSEKADAIEQKQMQLRSLLYEKHYLLREIKSCQEFE